MEQPACHEKSKVNIKRKNKISLSEYLLDKRILPRPTYNPRF